MTTGAAGIPAVLSVLADETRWRILTEVGGADLSASALAGLLPVSRQAIAKHLAVLADAGLVEHVRVGREIRYRAVGVRLNRLAADLESIGRGWDRRLEAIKRIAETTDRAARDHPDAHAAPGRDVPTGPAQDEAK